MSLNAAAPRMLNQCREWAESDDLIATAHHAGLDVLATVLKHRQEWAREILRDHIPVTFTLIHTRTQVWQLGILTDEKEPR